MTETSRNGSRSPASGKSVEIEVVAKPKRRRFSVAEKLRILREVDACAPGTVGAHLRQEGIYSSQPYAWRRERVNGALDPQAVSKHAKARDAEREQQLRIHQLEVENRTLQRKIARFELFEEIRKKAAGLLNLEYKSPRFRRQRLIEAAAEISASRSQRSTCAALGVSRSTLRPAERGRGGSHVRSVACELQSRQLMLR